MSFFSNNKENSRCPGPISGNATQGLCERVCIQTTKVFDSGIKQFTVTDATVTLTNLNPADPTEPLTFVGCSGASGQETVISNLVVDRFCDRPNFARVTADIAVPIVVTYTDADGVEGTGLGTLNTSVDVIMFVPQPALIPYAIEAFGSAVCSSGTFVSGTTFTISACVTIILKVVVEAQIMVPSYGYCSIPVLQDFIEANCNANTNLPLYPTSCTTNQNCRC